MNHIHNQMGIPKTDSLSSECALVSKLYDKLRPGWREQAKEPPIELTPEKEEMILEGLRPMMDAIDALKKEGN